MKNDEVKYDKGKRTFGLTFSRATLTFETLLLFSMVQACWGDLTAFRDDFKFGDLPWELRLLLPSDSLSDSAIPWTIAASILVWQVLGVGLSLGCATPAGRSAGIGQCQIAQLVTCLFWVFQISRMGFHQVLVTFTSQSWVPYITVGGTIVAFFVAEVFARKKGT